MVIAVVHGRTGAPNVNFTWLPPLTNNLVKTYKTLDNFMIYPFSDNIEELGLKSSDSFSHFAHYWHFSSANPPKISILALHM